MKRFLLWVVGVILGVAVLLGAVMTVSYSFTGEGVPPGGRHAVRRAGAGSERLLLAGAAAGRRVR